MSRGSTRRWAVAATSVSAHVLLALALLQGEGGGSRMAQTADVAAIGVSLVSAAPSPPAHETQPPTEATAAEPAPMPEPAADATAVGSVEPLPRVAPPEPAASTGVSLVFASDVEAPPGGCAVPDAVVAALKESGAEAALTRTPAARRSVANALMLWDGRWVTGGALADPAVARSVRAAFVQAVVASGPACAFAENTGPVLMLLPDRGGVLVLVVGSGQWRWSDVATSG